MPATIQDIRLAVAIAHPGWRSSDCENEARKILAGLELQEMKDGLIAEGDKLEANRAKARDLQAKGEPVPEDLLGSLDDAGGWPTDQHDALVSEWFEDAEDYEKARTAEAAKAEEDKAGLGWTY